MARADVLSNKQTNKQSSTDSLTQGADAVIDNVPVDQGMKDKAKEAVHDAIDKVDIEQVKAMAPKAVNAAKNVMGK